MRSLPDTLLIVAALVGMVALGWSGIPLGGSQTGGIVRAPLAQAPADDPLHQRGMAIEGFVESSGEEPVNRLIEMHFAPEYRDSLGPAALVELLENIRTVCGGADGVLWEPDGERGIRITFLREGREISLGVRIQSSPPHRISALDLEESRAAVPAGPTLAPFSWNSLEKDLEEAARTGFSGAVLVVRDGQLRLHEGYGEADRERRTPIGRETIFAIGSVPIDFTKGAILKLVEMGKLELTDSIGEFFPTVPGDKRGITIDHLMSGRSGLPNFHHIPGVDADFDLSWIDRETAIHRILGQDLLFTPGMGEAHSHSAWVLLAAVVEIASGQPYGEFLRQHFFAPAGMARTGQHEDAAQFPDEDFAIGYEGQSYGKVNIPKYWGRTSWLVMGSGGMYSTPLDLFRWLSAIRDGKTLSAESARRYWSHGVLAGGDDRGFFCIYTEGPENLMILCSNAHTRRGDVASQVGQRLIELMGAS